MEFPLSLECLTDLAVFAREKLDHENLGRYFRIGVDHDRWRNLFRRSAYKRFDLARRP